MYSEGTVTRKFLIMDIVFNKMGSLHVITILVVVCFALSSNNMCIVFIYERCTRHALSACQKSFLYAILIVKKKKNTAHARSKFCFIVSRILLKVL